MSNKRMGRPPKSGENMMAPIPLRLTPTMRDEIERIQAERMDGLKIADVIRLLLVEAIQARKAARS